MSTRTILLIFTLCLLQSTNHQTTSKEYIPQEREDLFEKAVEHIKQHEGWHTDSKHVGYGHVIKKGESFSLPISKEQGDSLLREDLRECISHFRHLGKDSLLIGVLAYNVGVYRIKGYKHIKKSNLLTKLENGIRRIENDYISYRKWNGKIIKSIQKRRERELELFYIPDPNQQGDM